MADGYKSALHIPLGIGVYAPSGTSGRGYGPLPFIVGVPGVSVGKGYGPLPFMLGVHRVVEITVKPRVGGGSPITLEIPKRKYDTMERQLRDDEDILTIIMAFVDLL